MSPAAPPAWLPTLAGRALLAWEQARFDEAVADVFGYHALQLGLPALHALAANRMPHRWLAATAADGEIPAAAHLMVDPAALPFAEASLDLLALPHTLELCANPHAALREAHRVLVHEGRIVITGFSPWRARLWQMWRLLRGGRAGWQLLAAHQCIAARRLCDWLRLLNFEPQQLRPAAPCSRPPHALAHAAYCVTAIKRTHGALLLGARWKNPAAAAAPVPVAQKNLPDAAPAPSSSPSISHTDSRA